jgi:SAM-dependent methyltransferase
LQGLDLTPAHLDITRRRISAQGLSNVSLALGDFHHLPHADASIDAAFCIEAFCYATDLPRALAEACRVLRPGGTFTLFDGYLPRPPRVLQPDEALAVELVAKGMAIEGLQVQDELLAAARAVGFEVQTVHALDAPVMPSLRRLERLTAPFVRWPWFGRRALTRRHPARGRNVLAGCLMRGCVALGLIGHRQIVLRKAPA